MVIVQAKDSLVPLYKTTLEMKNIILTAIISCGRDFYELEKEPEEGEYIANDCYQWLEGETKNNIAQNLADKLVTLGYKLERI